MVGYRYKAPGQQAAPVYDEFKGEIHVVELHEVDRWTQDFPGRQWLERKVQEEAPVGWDIEWVPDRSKEQSNPVALMQFADEEVALLLRTHRSRGWLPDCVMQALTSHKFKKCGVGYDGNDKQKMRSTFDLDASGMHDVAIVAKERKGLLSCQGLKALSEHFEYKPKKDTRIARSNWASQKLSPDQVRYAAEDAYFTYLIHLRLEALPDVGMPEVSSIAVEGGITIVELRPGWSDQGIERRADGLYCRFCDRGPMTVAGVVQSHMQGAKHKRLVENKKKAFEKANAAVPELSSSYLEQYIVAGDGVNGTKIGEFVCTLCKAGPFISFQVIDAHINSKRHQKAINPEEEVVEVVEEKETFEDSLWNLPDYILVQEEEDKTTLFCTLCQAKSGALQPMFMHLNSDRHVKKCRSQGHHEIIYVKERDRMEILSTGHPVVRSGFTKPRHAAWQAPQDNKDEDDEAEQVDESEESWAIARRENESPLLRARKDPVSQEPATSMQELDTCVPCGASLHTDGNPQDPSLLPDGWEEFVDPTTDIPYYWCEATQECLWERPVASSAEGTAAAVSAAKADVKPSDAANVEEEREAQLPPGWLALRCEEDCKDKGLWYYVDEVKRITQWQRPSIDREWAWRRHVDPAGRAYWACEDKEAADVPKSFFELGESSTWERLVDRNGRILWNSNTMGIRFWEPQNGETLQSAPASAALFGA